MSESGYLVAVVDDDASVRKALSRLLGAAGFRVASYPCGAKFLEGLAEHVPDCLVLDLHMPNMNGLEVQSRIAASGLHLPIVVITAYDDPTVCERMLAAGAAAYLAKPFTMQLLLDAVTAAISDIHPGASAS